MASQSGDGMMESEVAKSLDLSVVRYSKVWEDHRVLSQALDIQPDDVVLSITSSGDQTLNLLLDKPRKIVSVDMSPAQNSVLELKLAAIRHLSYDDFLVLLGETDDSGEKRMDVYEEVKVHMPQYAQDYWDSNSETLRNGLNTCGRLDSYFTRLHKDLEHSSEEIDAFFGAQNMKDQNVVFHQMASKKLEQTLSCYVSKEQQKRMGRSEAQLKYVEQSDGTVVGYFWRRFCKVGLNIPARDNFYLSWFLRGNRGYNPKEKPEFAPPYITESGFTKLKDLVDRVEVHTGTLEDYLFRHNTDTVNKGNFSDIFEYVSKQAADLIFITLANHFSPGGRFAYWNLLVPRAPPSHILRTKLTHCKELSEKLHSRDRVFFYSTFNVFETK